MKKILLLLLLISSFTYSQIESLCEQCVEQNGFYCGDDPANWTQYSPNGCVPNGLNNLFYLNDGWEDCVDASDEGVLDTLFIDVIEYVDVFIYDTIVEIEYIEFIEYITEYVDCDTGLPCNSSIPELLNKYEQKGVIYNTNGQAIKEREGLYIEDGKVKFLIR